MIITYKRGPLCKRMLISAYIGISLLFYAKTIQLMITESNDWHCAIHIIKLQNTI